MERCDNIGDGVKDFDGVRIIPNYKNPTEVIDILFKNIPTVPAILGASYFHTGRTSQRFHIPFKFPDNIFKTPYEIDLSKIDPDDYNSKEGEIIVSGSMALRFMNAYNIYDPAKSVGKEALILTETIEDVIHEKNKIMIYGISEPAHLYSSKFAWKDRRPIMTVDDASVESLFRHAEVFPAQIHRLPMLNVRDKGTNVRDIKRMNKKSTTESGFDMEDKFDAGLKGTSLDFTVYFKFNEGIDTTFGGSEYNIRLNNQSLNEFMFMLNVNTHEELIGKDIHVYTNYSPGPEKLTICGATSSTEYLAKSLNFSNFHQRK